MGGTTRRPAPRKPSPKAANGTAAQRSRPHIDFQLPRFNLHDTVTKIAEQTGANIVADSYFKPRPRIAIYNATKRPFRLRVESVEDALKQLCDLFDYRWKKEGNPPSCYLRCPCTRFGCHMYRPSDWQ
jgi:hypothetical protein